MKMNPLWAAAKGDVKHCSWQRYALFHAACVGPDADDCIHTWQRAARKLELENKDE
jgi:hypothetical protein